MKRCDCEARDADRCAERRGGGERVECRCACHGAARPEPHPVFHERDPRELVT